MRQKSNHYKRGPRKPPCNPIPTEIGSLPFRMNSAMNATIQRHYKPQQQQLAQHQDNNYTFNQHLSQTQRGLIAVGMNYDHLTSTLV
jgi:hypothetical protein